MDDSQPKNQNRKMVSADLCGQHSHPTSVCTDVHIWIRAGKYIARGRLNGSPFGVTLGSNAKEATISLRRLLVEIEDGTFRRASDRPKKKATDGRVPKLTMRQLFDLFLDHTRRSRGAKTEKNYRSKLGHILDFAERRDVCNRWPKAMDIDENFAAECRTFLMNRSVRRNGRHASQLKPMSLRQIQNCLSTLQNALGWALKTSVRNLPPEFINPITSELIGQPPSKDPLRRALVPLDTRVRLVESMNCWEVLNLSLLLVVPLRFEDVQRLLVSDVDFDRNALLIRNGFGGANFNKARLEITWPLPEQLVQLLHIAIDGREQGPLFLGRSNSKSLASLGMDEFDSRLDEAMLKASAKGRIQSEQDRKEVFCSFIRSIGGLPKNAAGKHFKALLKSVGLKEQVRAYDIRGSVKQDIKDSGVEYMTARYLCEHNVGDGRRDALPQYVGVDPFSEVPKYFERIATLLNAIQVRCEKLPTLN